MKNVIILFLFSVVFMYATFASGHYLDGAWFKYPTMLLTGFLGILNLSFFVVKWFEFIQENKT